MYAIEIDRRDIRRLACVEQALRPLAEGEVRLVVEGFALTANNVTYAATGDILKYWQFFPATTDGKGLVPVWGHARVSESRSDVLAVGALLYGFLPMAEGLVIHPAPRGAAGVSDMAGHRQGLSPIYNFYAHADEADLENRARRAIFHPLLATSWLIADFLADNGWFGAEQVVVSSASGKTGLGLCRFLGDHRPDGPKIVGLTSGRNKAFVQGLGLCDAVVTYDRIADDIARTASVFVDMAGSAEIRRDLHRHLGGELRHSAAVGASHWEEFQPSGPMPGAKPTFFFAPAQIEKRRADWGPGVVEARIEQAWQAVAAESANWLSVAYVDGLEAAATAFRTIADGRSDPARGTYVRL